jgi:hypothetical protein
LHGRVRNIVSKNILIIKTERTFAMSFHSKQIRVSSRLQITSKNIKLIYQSELRFLGIYIIKNLNWGTCLIIKSKAMQRSSYEKNIKRNNEPLYGKQHFVRGMVLYYGVVIMKVTKFLNCNRRSFE